MQCRVHGSVECISTDDLVEMWGWQSPGVDEPVKRTRISGPVGCFVCVIVAADLRVETVHDELRAKESKHDGVGGGRDRHAGSKNRSQAHIVSDFPDIFASFRFWVKMVDNKEDRSVGCLWYDRREEWVLQIQAESWMDDTTACFMLLELRTTRIF